MIEIRETIELQTYTYGEGWSPTDVLENRVVKFNSVDDVKNVSTEDFEEYFENQYSAENEIDEIKATYTIYKKGFDPMFDEPEEIVAEIKFTLDELNENKEKRYAE